MRFKEYTYQFQYRADKLRVRLRRRKGRLKQGGSPPKEGTLQKLFNDINDQGNKQAEQDHGHYGEIKTKIFPFYPDITWQPAYPVQLIMQEIDQ